MEWSLANRKISDLIPHPKNPRRMSKETADHLRKSLEKFGVCEPIVINHDNTIIGGHQRISTLKRMKVKEVIVMIPSKPLEDHEVDELCLRLNKNIGDFDDDLLANSWDLDLLVDCGFDLQDFKIDENDDNFEEKGATITISLTSAKQADELEPKIYDLVDSYLGATVKVKKK